MAPTSSGSISSLAIPLLPTSSQWVSPRCLPNSWLVARFFGRRSLEVIDPGVIRFFLRSCEVSGNRNSYPSIKVSAGSGWWLEGQGDPKLPSEAIHFFSSPPLRLAFPTRPPPKYILAFLFSAFWLCFWYQCWSVGELSRLVTSLLISLGSLLVFVGELFLWLRFAFLL
ncbi:hypothetical protein V6N11_031084 [Hibiscus sabdariffa]|uniref:Uncharacterized protein n=1 Tax=Hibiscus sabdariffa TaxID=183260 RepID=A0ABR1ZWG2_9ROSI